MTTMYAFNSKGHYDITC